jgi:hypothetical protein
MTSLNKNLLLYAIEAITTSKVVLCIPATFRHFFSLFFLLQSTAHYAYLQTTCRCVHSVRFTLSLKSDFQLTPVCQSRPATLVQAIGCICQSTTSA